MGAAFIRTRRRSRQQHSEYVIYLVEGQDVRYSEIEQIEAAIAQRGRSLQPNN